MIREESDKLVKGVRDYERKLTNHVEVYNAELTSKRERIEEARGKLQRMMNERYVTVQILEGDQLIDELLKSLEIEHEITQAPGVPVLGPGGKLVLRLVSIVIALVCIFYIKQ